MSDDVASIVSSLAVQASTNSLMGVISVTNVPVLNLSVLTNLVDIYPDGTALTRDGQIVIGLPITTNNGWRTVGIGNFTKTFPLTVYEQLAQSNKLYHERFEVVADPERWVIKPEAHNDNSMQVAILALALSMVTLCVVVWRKR